MNDETSSLATVQKSSFSEPNSGMKGGYTVEFVFTSEFCIF